MNTIVSRSSIVLGLFALATTLVVTITHQLTAPEIAKQQALATLANLNAIIPDELYTNDLIQDCIVVHDDFNNPIKVFRARKIPHNNQQSLSETDTGIENTHNTVAINASSKNIALAIETIAPDGYNGRIDLLVAIDLQGKILGVRSIKHTETPGLGDKIEIEKSNWITSFNNKKLKNIDDPNWAVKKDGGMFDQFTGATITPRAVVKSVKRTLNWYQINKADLFNLPAHCGEI